MPAKGYESVNVPTGLYTKIRRLIDEREDLGYRSVTEFVAESVRMPMNEIEQASTYGSLLKVIERKGSLHEEEAGR